MVSDKRKWMRVQELAKKPRKAADATESDKRSRFYRIAETIDRTIETHPVARLCGLCFAVFGGLILIGTGVQIMWEYEERQAERISRAWETLSRPILGNTGKGAALSYLIEQGHEINGLRLSCETMGGEVSSISGCDPKFVVSGIKIEKKSEKISYYSEWIIDGITITNSEIYNSFFSNTRMSYVFIEGSIIDSTTIFANGYRGYGEKKATQAIVFEKTVLTNGEFAIFDRLYVYNSFISGSRFSSNLLRIKGSFATANDPPFVTRGYLSGGRKPEKYAIGGVSYCDPTLDLSIEEIKSQLNQSVGGTAFIDCSWNEKQARAKYPDVWGDILPANNTDSGLPKPPKPQFELPEGNILELQK